MWLVSPFHVKCSMVLKTLILIGANQSSCMPIIMYYSLFILSLIQMVAIRNVENKNFAPQQGCSQLKCNHFLSLHF